MQKKTLCKTLTFQPLQPSHVYLSPNHSYSLQSLNTHQRPTFFAILSPNSSPSEKSLHPWYHRLKLLHLSLDNKSALMHGTFPDPQYPKLTNLFSFLRCLVSWQETTPAIKKKPLYFVSYNKLCSTCRVLICWALNLLSTYLNTKLVFPTQPSPNKTTLKSWPFVAFCRPFAAIVDGKVCESV